MPRILGTTIPDEKNIVYSLTYVYGIGFSLAQQILEKTSIDQGKKAKDLTEKELNEIKQVVDGTYKIEGELRRKIVGDIKRLKEVKCHRGSRHSKSLPVRGQKTRKNSRTIRGNVRKTVGSGRKGAPAPK